MKRALLTGITGQDGSYLAELLLDRGYEVHGILRRSSSFNTGRIEHIFDRLHLHHGDLSDGAGLARLLRTVRPDEIYNLGAMSHVKVSFDIPEYTADVVAVGALRLLEAIRDSDLTDTRYYQASSSELFGSSPPPQNEHTPFRPRSPYAISKLHAYWTTVNYREAYGIHASNGILMNHESERRGPTFVTRKITMAVAKIKHGRQDKLFLGNLDAKRDWGHAADFVEAMHLMLQQDKPDDYVIATGVCYSVRDFLDLAFSRVDLDWRRYVEIDPKYFRPTEVDDLRGDASKAREKLRWKPKVTFEDLVARMVDADMALEAAT